MGIEVGPEMKKYKCHKCGVTGVKLWRQCHTFSDEVELKCANCAAPKRVDATGRINGKYGRTDQVGGMVPAVPAGRGSFWRYTSVPDADVRWWRSLPTYPEDREARDGD